MSDLRKILLVEDEVDLREILALVLETEIDDVEIAEVSSGNEAITYLASNQVDLIISDYTMFDGTGGDLFQHLVKTEAKTPFVLLTGGYIEDYTEFANASNVDFFKGVQYKPFDSDKLSELVNSILSSSSAGGESESESSSSDYFEIPLEVFEKVSYLHVNTYTKIGESKFVKIISDTDKNPLDQFVHFKQKGINKVYIEKRNLSNYLLMAQDFLIEKFSKGARTMDQIEVGDFIFEFSKVALDFVGVTEQVYGVVNEQIGKISKDVSSSKNPGKMLKEAAESKNYLGSHCVMTAYLSVFILQKMNLTESANVRKLIIAAFFHDISLKDQSLAKKIDVPDDLDSNSKRLLLNHMDLSCEFIEKIVKVGEEDIFNVIKQHHERPDGKGFPKGLNYKTIQPLAAVFIMAHEVVRYFFETNFNLPGLTVALSKMSEEWRQGNFEKPYKAIVESLEENETN